MKKIIFSDDTKYRYAHSTTWDTSKPSIMFITLHPIANEKLYHNDAEVQKGNILAKEWGYGTARFCSLFAYFAKEGENIFLSGHPIGIDNDEYILRCMLSSNKIICAWGDNGVKMKRDKQVIEMLSRHKKLHYIELTQSGNPKQLEEFSLTIQEPTTVL